MSKNGSGPAKESGLSEFDDIKAHSETLEKTFKQASDIIAACHRGFTPAEKKKFKKELPEIVGRLRQLLEAQLQKGGGIQSLDLADGSYDNVHTDHIGLGFAVQQVEPATRFPGVTLNELVNWNRTVQFKRSKCLPCWLERYVVMTPLKDF
jgi:hypothetical protein